MSKNLDLLFTMLTPAIFPYGALGYNTGLIARTRPMNNMEKNEEVFLTSFSCESSDTILKNSIL